MPTRTKVNSDEPISFETSQDEIDRRSSYKRFLDLSILVSAHVLLLPLWVILWILLPLLIVLEDGPPVFYRQRRVGKRGKTFTIIKFRSLRRRADEEVKAWEIPDDDVVTTVGSLLRKTGLDELPQIINILKGEMSFVGPRAMPVDEYEAVRDRVPNIDVRFMIRPGLTGLAQVYGRGTRDVSEKLEYDCEYLRQMGPILDCRLVMHSIVNTIRGHWDQDSGAAKL